MEKPYRLSGLNETQYTNTPIENPGVDNPLSETTENITTDSTIARLEFDISGMTQFIKDRGIKVLWERSYLCTCLDTKTGAPRVECPRCYGKGIAYLPPVPTIMAIQSQGKNGSIVDLGMLETGTAIGTTQLEHRISYRDRFTVPDVIIPQSMIFLVTKERYKKGIPLLYDVKRITYIVSDEDILYEDVDYSIKNNRLFVKEDLIGHNVSLNVYMTLRYTVTDILKESRYQYTEFNQPSTRFDNLPQKLLLKREDVIIRPEAYIPAEGMGDNTEIEAQIEDTKAKPSNDSNNLSGFFGGGLNEL